MFLASTLGVPTTPRGPRTRDRGPGPCLLIPIFGFAVLWYSYYTKYGMAPREKVITFRPDNDTFDAMASLRERDGVPFSEQIRRALRAWLEAKGAIKKAPPHVREHADGADS